MRAIRSADIIVYVGQLVVGTLIIVLSLYVAYEKGWLAIQLGETKTRTGTVFLSKSQLLFWFCVTTDMVSSLLFAITGWILLPSRFGRRG